MPTTSEDPQSVPDALDEDDDPTAIADDGMAPLINNTGADDTEGDDADATSG